MKPAARRLLAACLFCSGAASLVMEVAWSRALSLALGNSHQAVATVVASMMTGLCLGSLLAARFLPRISQLARAYGLIEMGVGAYGLLTPASFSLLPILLGPLYALPSPLFPTLRFLIVFVVLLPPSAGMGATLPVLVAAISRGEGTRTGDSSAAGGRLYGLNTLGAFLGTLAGGFLLLPGLGLFGSTLAGAATSFSVGTLVWLLSESMLREAPAPAAAPASSRKGDAAGAFAWILPLYAVSGALAMIYEITWTRVLAPIAGSSVYSFALILATILAGIGFGSLLLSTRIAARLDPAPGFVAGQIFLSAAALLSMWGLARFPDLMLRVAARHPSEPGRFLLGQFLLFALIVLLPGILLGALFPFASRLLKVLEAEAGAEVGRVYAWNTAGSIVGSLAAGFLLVETLGSETTLALAAIGSASLGLAGVALSPGRYFRPVAGVSAGVLALCIPLLTPPWDLYRMTSGITQLLRHLREQPGTPVEELNVGATSPDVRIVFHREGKTSPVTVVKEWLDYWLPVDGKTDASTGPNDMSTQVLLGQLPFFFAREPRDACVIGYGSGVTSHAVLTHPVRSLDTIEIERQVIEASPFFERVNHRPLSDPRSRLLVEDARTALAYRPRDYDVIISEPSNPWMAGVNNLFTTEFYALVKKRLRPGGVFCQWVQYYELSAESLHVIMDTLTSTFPHTLLFASHTLGDMFLIASDRPLELVPGAAQIFPDRPAVSEDLAQVGVRDLSDLAILFTLPLAPAGKGAKLNTDDNSFIQYRAPLDLLRGTEPANMGLRTSREDLQRIFYPGRDENEVLRDLGEAARRRRAVATMTSIADLLESGAHPEYGRKLREEAEELDRVIQTEARVAGSLTRAEILVAQKNPDSALASFREAESMGLTTAEHFSRAGFLLMLLGRYEEAEKYLDRVVKDPEPRFQYQCLAARGACRFRTGRRPEGIEDINGAKALDPTGPLAYLLYGLALFDAGERDAAAREYHGGLEVAPGDPRLLSALALASVPGAAPAPAAPSAAPSSH